MLEGLSIHAKPVLAKLVKQRPTPERFLLLATAMWHRQDPITEQIAILHQLIASTDPSDTRCGEAWKRIGELSLQSDEGITAIEAFKKAEHYGWNISHLQEFRNGNWDAIAGLKQHPNYAFPVVVALDIECDYHPDAEPGSCVFEIGAVRVKGNTELAYCNIVIRRDFISPKVAQRQEEAVVPEQAVAILLEFIGTSIVVGHNLQAFDAVHLRGMGLSITEDQIIDTLTVAYWLYPDSIHHHLALLCREHHISFQGDQHTALPDAQACASLLHALGDELMRRGEQLLSGFRAFIPPDSAFDRAILQPRGVAADPTLVWNLDSSPSESHILATVQEVSKSQKIIDALVEKKDVLIERYDPSGEYVQHLPLQQRVIVVVNSRTRLERMLALAQEKLHPLVLPDPNTLLCPHRFCEAIEQAQSWQMKLTLFCLYQASHNHDARTLYPLRLPSSDSSLNELRQLLLSSCCPSDCHHADTCPGVLAMQDAIEQHRVIFATHESFLHQPRQPQAEVIIIDDADKLQMHFAEYLAQQVTSEQVQSCSLEAFQLIDEYIQRYIQYSMSSPIVHKRLPLQEVATYFTQPQQGHEHSLLDRLKSLGPAAKDTTDLIETLCHHACQKGTSPEEMHVYWLELHVSREPQSTVLVVEHWRMYGVKANIAKAFHNFFWKPYQQHIICGSAIALGDSKTTFLIRFFGLPEDIDYQADDRPTSCIYIPSQEIMSPYSFLARSKWAMSISVFLYQIANVDQRSLIISLEATPIANALAEAFRRYQQRLKCQVVSLPLGWTTAKIRERLTNKTRSTMAFIPPKLRETVLDDFVDIEATGPLRFLNQQDPLVAAHMILFNHLFPSENPFSSYLLPQALLELKARISSPARIHIILDSGLNSKAYRDEVHSLLQQDTILETLSGISNRRRSLKGTFPSVLDNALERWGMSVRTHVDDETLHLVLQTYWRKDRFREAPLNQKEAVHQIFKGKDQLIIASTGSGKSLCFQLPAILLAQDNIPKVTLVVSPLLALMKNQVETLKDKSVFSAIMWNSRIAPAQKQAYLDGIKRGWYSIVYIAPEQIHSSALRQALETREIGLIAIDEAHCVSEWGHNFRTEYIALKNWIKTQLCGGHPRLFPILALTATARNGYPGSNTEVSERGTVQDIIDNLSLSLDSSEVKMPTPERPELEFCVEHITIPCSMCHYPLTVNTGDVKCQSCGKWCFIAKDTIQKAKIEKLVALLAERSDKGLRQRWDRTYGERQRGLIYCAYTKTTEELASLLRHHPQLKGLRIVAYHGKMSREEGALDTIYRAFTSDGADGVDIVVATNAFGMGIDVRRLGFVIHFDIPETIEAYIQEAGRAGRDSEFQQGGAAARCILFYHEADIEKRRFLQSRNTIDGQSIVSVYDALRKCNTHEEREIYVTQTEIQRLAGIEKKEENKINPLLFYLERFAFANGKRVIERGENVQTQWLLAFEHGYEQRIQDSNISDLSQNLIAVFQTSTEFLLHEREVRMIDGEKLAEAMSWEFKTLLAETKNLLRRHILVNANRWSICWLKSKIEAYELVTHLAKNVITVLLNTSDQDACIKSKRVSVNIELLYDKGLLKPIPLQLLTKFLAELSHSNGCMKLFSHFKRTTSGEYELELVKTSSFKDIRLNLFQQLWQIIQYYTPEKQCENWQSLDMLMKEADYVQRGQLEQYLLLFKELGMLSLEQPRKQDDTAMRIIFKQENISDEQLTIDLSGLHLIERNNRRKLELMKEYATISPEQRQPMVNTYFTGAVPLLTPFKMRSDLTKQQGEIVTISGGYHLITGPAGSGKTTILEEHIRYLVEGKFVPPDRILVVTYNKSAVERISSHTNVYQSNGKTIVAKTLNNIGKRIFSSNRELLQRPNGQLYFAEKMDLRLFTWDSREECSLMQEVLEQIRQEQVTESNSFKDWLRLDERSIKARLESMQRFRQFGVYFDRPEAKTLCGILKFGIDKTKTAEFLHEMYCRYLLSSADKGWYTYDDQILFALTILKAQPDIAKKNQWSYEHIIVDEFQDLTPAQIELVGILGKRCRNVLAFGDNSQDIHVKQDGRGYNETSSPLTKRFAQISRDLAPDIHLKTNFRSVQEILDVAGFIRNNSSIDIQQAARGTSGKKLVVISIKNTTFSPSQNSVNGILCAMVDEALQQIKSLSKEESGSVALMVAKSNRSQEVQNYLQERKEPFCVLGNDSGYQSQYVEHVLAYFRLIEDSKQDAEIKQILWFCMPGKQIWRLGEIAEKYGKSLFDIIQDNEILQQIGVTLEQKKMLQQQLSILQAFHSESQFADVWQAISELETGPLSKELTNEQQAQLRAVQDTFRNETVAQALEDIRSHVTFLEEHHTNRQLVVTSIDQAKSQEFDTVFLLGADLLNKHSSNHRARLYVSVSRARQRLFFLVDDRLSESQKQNTILSGFPKELYTEM